MHWLKSGSAYFICSSYGPLTMVTYWWTVRCLEWLCGRCSRTGSSLVLGPL